MNKRKKPSDTFKRQAPRSPYKRLGSKILQAGLATGVIAWLITSVYDFCVGDVSLTFLKPHGRYYEFTLENDSPAEQKIEYFKVTYPELQQPIARITRDVYGTQSADGGVALPGGNISYMPIIEFHELDGQTLPARKPLKFLLPPTSSRNYLQMDAAIYDVQYVATPTNPPLHWLDKVLKTIKMRNESVQLRYLVVENNWIPTSSKSPDEALRIACRDDDSLSVGKLCPLAQSQQ